MCPPNSKEQEKAKEEVANESASESDADEEEYQAAIARNQRLEQSIIENQRRTIEAQRRTMQAMLSVQEAEDLEARLLRQYESLENEIAVRQERAAQWRKAAEEEKKKPGNEKEDPDVKG